MGRNKEAVPGKDGFMGLLKDLSGCGTKGPSHRGKFTSQDGAQSRITELLITLALKNRRRAAGKRQTGKWKILPKNPAGSQERCRRSLFAYHAMVYGMETHKVRALVTGGAGFIGSNLVKRLVADGHDVVAADTFFSSHWNNLVDVHVPSNGTPPDVLTLENRLDIDSIRGLVKRDGSFDVIFHQAALTGVIARDGSAAAGEDFQGFLRNNVEQFRQILELAFDTSARVVWASSCSVYGRGKAPQHERDPYDPLNVYAFSKVSKERLAARYAKKFSLPIVGLRYSNVYGPGEDHKGKLASMIHQLARQMRAGKRPRIFTAGEQRRDFVYVDDVVEANLKAAKAKESGVYNAGAGRSWSFNDVVRELNRVLKTNLAPDYFDNPYSFTQDHTETDMSLAKEKLGHMPQFDLARGIDAYFASGKLGISC